VPRGGSGPGLRGDFGPDGLELAARAHMKGPAQRTKVVLRRLPPAIAQQAVVDQVDARFAGRYDWACFRAGNASQKNHRYSRLYLNFKSPEDVVEFADFFNGHVFVNEKGAQFKALVEYAPSQQVPKSNIKKDARQGTIAKGLK
jgi:regulator of nonsense transcripts 3